MQEKSAEGLDRVWEEVVGESRDGGAPSPVPRRSWLLHLLFAPIPLILLLLTSELLLWLLGVAPPFEKLSSSRGFDPRARYIVADSGTRGGFRTQIFDDPAREMVIEPKGSRRRVLLFGGSNTVAFTPSFLERELGSRQRPEDDTEYQVLNLGRGGYGSGRVTILLRQAHVLDPDLVVIYSGHNEFVELGFEIDLEQHWMDGRLRRIADAFMELRTFRALVEVFGSAGEASGTGPPPEQWAWEGRKFANITFAETKQRFEDYRENLRRMCREAKRQGIAIYLCTLIGNDFSPPFVSEIPPEWSAEERARFRELREMAREKLPERMRRMLPRDLHARLNHRDWSGHVREVDMALLASLPQPFLRPGVTSPSWREAGWPGLEIWSERVVPFLTSAAHWHLRRLEQPERRDVEEALARLEQARARAPRHAGVHFELAICTYLLGDDQRSAELFRLAGRYDCAPRRATDTTNEIVREVAASEGVRLVDFARIFGARCPDGLFGWEWLMDECHIHHGVRDEVLRILAKEIEAAR